MDIAWEEPSPVRRAGGGRPRKYEGIREKLQRRPGAWARLDTKSTPNQAGSLVRHINSPRSSQYPALRGCEATYRTVGPDCFAVYVRWPEGKPS